MTFSARIGLAAAVASAALLWGAVTGVRTIACLAIALALASLLRGRLSSLSTPLQGLLLLASGLTALFLITLSPFSADAVWADRPLHRAWALLGSGSLLLAAVRIHLHEPEGGVVATVGLGLICLLACGSVVSGSVYLLSLLLYTPFMFMAVRCADPHRSSWFDLGWRHRASLAGMAGVTALLTALLLVLIPSLYDRASGWVLRWMDDELQVGFHAGPMALGSLRGLLDSDEIVMRVEGEVGGRLRGNVYTTYADGYWLASDRAEAEPNVIADWFDEDVVNQSGLDSRVAVIQHAGGEGDRFFLPLDAERLELVPSRVRIDPYGIARTEGREEAPQRARLQLGSVRRLRPAPPRAEDSDIPFPLRQQFEAIAAEWTRDARSAAERVGALQTRLETSYTYSLQFERSSGRRGGSQTEGAADAILQFLLEDPQGHCEYFASALTLLVRASGLPSRLVTGYRVTERNPLGDYYIVRQRHAHAWVEVHLGESGWTVFDPSPIRSAEGPAAASTPWAAALWDWGGVELRRRGPAPFLLMLVLVFAGVQLRRLGLARSRARQRSAEDAPSGPSSSPFVLELLLQLGRRGWMRSEGETLEALARRLRFSQGSGPLAVEGADALLARVAALRYGGQGDSRDLARDIRAWVAGH